MNEFLKQAFAHCSELNGELEEVMETFEDCCAFCKVSVSDGGYDFLVNIELNEFDKYHYKVNDEIKFKLALMYDDDGEVFKDEDEFFKGTYGKSYAPNSFVPITYHYEDGAHEDSSAFVIGKVISVENIDIDSEQFSHIQIFCLDCVLDLFCETACIPPIEAGNIICGLFDTIGLAI